MKDTTDLFTGGKRDAVTGIMQNYNLGPGHLVIQAEGIRVYVEDNGGEAFNELQAAIEIADVIGTTQKVMFVHVDDLTENELTNVRAQGHRV